MLSFKFINKNSLFFTNRISNYILSRFFDGVDTSLYLKGKERGLFKSTIDERQKITERRRDKKINKQRRKLISTEKKSQKIQNEIIELQLEKKKAEKLKELEEKFVNDAVVSDEEIMNEEA